MKNGVFLIDSEKLDETESGLYGYMITENGELVTEGIPDSPGRSGSFVLVKRNGSKISVTQDLCGSFGLFVYRNGDYFALSDSLLCLARHLKGRIHLNDKAVKALIHAKYAPVSYKETPVKEIVKLSSQDEAVIDTEKKTLSIVPHVFPYFRTRPEDALEELDRWYAKWVHILRKMVQSGYPVYADLSGGLDTRIILGMLINGKVDLNSICILSHEKVNLDKDRDDYRIASQIAERYGFTLNHDPNTRKKTGVLDPAECYERTAELSFGNTLMNKYILYRNESPVILLKGFFSSIKGNTYMNRTENAAREYMQEYRRWQTGFSIGKLAERRMYDRYVRQQIGEMNDVRYGDDRDASLVFQRIICEKMDAYKSLDSTLRGEYVVSPFNDPDIAKFDYMDPERNDQLFLALLILQRYCPELLDFEIQGRTIRSSTLEKAAEISSLKTVRIDAPEDSAVQQPQIIRRMSLKKDDMKAYLAGIWHSEEFTGMAEKYTGKDVCRRMIEAADDHTLNSRPEPVNGLLAVHELSRYTE